MTPYQSNSNNSGNSNSGSNASSNDSKKDEFRKYLENTNVLDALTKVLVGLFEEPERPRNALEYIRKYLGAPSSVDVDALRRENEELKTQLEKANKQIEELKKRQGMGTKITL